MHESQLICEDILREQIRYNLEAQVLPSETAIANRLLARPAELVDAYAELHSKLRHDNVSLTTFLGLLLSAAAFWNPEEMAEARRKRNMLEIVNGQIADRAFELAELLRERTDLHEHSGFHTDTHYHVLRVIEEAANGNHRFDMYLRQELRLMRGQYDLKYWPSIPDFVSVLAVDADRARAAAYNPVTAAGTDSSRPSRADFFRAWFEIIDDNRGGGLPRDLRIGDSSLASLGNCALDLGENEIVDAAYVKRLRQRSRDARRTSTDDASATNKE